ncbi:MAG: hypothetical protein LIO67_05605 [Lachnospiraceae bacterium]|nr:hypothetical protein [Lachnospiraceae bacterium]
MADKRAEYHIPQNYNTSRKLADLADARGLAEGVILALPILKGITLLHIDGTWKLTACVTAAILCILAGSFGFNGEYLSEFLLTLFRYAQGRRIVYYNPRVKLEAKPEYLEEKEKTLLPRERIQRFLGRMEETETEEQYLWEANEIYFEDDIGVVEKPEALKTGVEKRKDRRKRKQSMEKHEKPETGRRFFSCKKSTPENEMVMEAELPQAEDAEPLEAWEIPEIMEVEEYEILE